MRDSRATGLTLSQPVDCYWQKDKHSEVYFHVKLFVRARDKPADRSRILISSAKDEGTEGFPRRRKRFH